MRLSGNIWPQLPAGIKGFRPPCCNPHACPWLRTHQPVGRLKDPGGKGVGGKSLPPIHCPRTPCQCQERDKAALNTGLYWR